MLLVPLTTKEERREREKKNMEGRKSTCNSSRLSKKRKILNIIRKKCHWLKDLCWNIAWLIIINVVNFQQIYSKIHRIQIIIMHNKLPNIL